MLNYQRVPSPSHHRFFGCYVFHPLLKLWGSDADPPVQQDEDHACHQGGSSPPLQPLENEWNVMKPRPPWPILFDDLPNIYVYIYIVYIYSIYIYSIYIYCIYIYTWNLYITISTIYIWDILTCWFFMVHSHGQLYGWGGDRPALWPGDFRLWHWRVFTKIPLLISHDIYICICIYIY